jgi:hypothetical protein
VGANTGARTFSQEIGYRPHILAAPKRRAPRYGASLVDQQWLWKEEFPIDRCAERLGYNKLATPGTLNEIGIALFGPLGRPATVRKRASVTQGLRPLSLLYHHSPLGPAGSRV